MTATLERLLDLVPVHHRARDAAPGGGGGTLTALLTAVAGEIELLERDVERLADGWFAETCEEWLIPYLADLVGLHEVPPELGVAVSRRALVANTVAYRRRKGTVAVLEQVTRDVTGWPARAVEYHPLLAASAHVNHVRLDRAAAASLRGAGRIELSAVTSPPAAGGALDPLPHTAEVRRMASGRGRYGIANVGVFPFPVQTYRVGAARTPPGQGPADGWSRARAAAGWQHFDPLGRAVPLFAPPHREQAIESLATEPDLPVPLRPRRLLELLRGAATAAELPIGVRIGATGQDLPPERIRVCRIDDVLDVEEPQVMVDPIAGRLRAYRKASPADPVAPYAPSTVYVRYAYGALADVGAGTYDRSDLHQRALASDVWTPDPSKRDFQVAVPSTGIAGVAAALTAVEDRWATTPEAVGATATVSIGDCRRYEGAHAVDVPAATRLVVVAAHWRGRVLPSGDQLEPVAGVYAADGLRPHLKGDLSVTGGPGSSVMLDGLVLEGNLVVEPGALGSLTLAHVTVTGAVLVDEANAALEVRVLRSVLARLDLGARAPRVSVSDSVIDAGDAVALGGGAAHASLEGATVRGDVAVRSLDASSCIVDGTVTAEHRQVGCLRFSYAGPGSRTPHRYRCAPSDGPAPVYLSTDAASPAYLGLAGSCSPLISTGGEGESEMGVHHHLKRPLRARAAQRQLGPYLPVGSQLGILGS
jgi:hypothetical protein